VWLYNCTKYLKPFVWLQGLMTPIIKNADQKTISAISSEVILSCICRFMVYDFMIETGIYGMLYWQIKEQHWWPSKIPLITKYSTTMMHGYDISDTMCIHSIRYGVTLILKLLGYDTWYIHIEKCIKILKNMINI